MAPVHSVLVLWPGAIASQGQAPSQHDSVVRAWDSVTQRFVDSVAIRSPLPDPLIPLVQWMFQKPGWVMVGGIVLGVMAAFAVLLFLWPRRRAITGWLATRDRGVKLAMVGVLGIMLLLVVGAGLKSYDFMMHDNDFCAGCHLSLIHISEPTR